MLSYRGLTCPGNSLAFIHLAKTPVLSGFQGGEGGEGEERGKKEEGGSPARQPQRINHRRDTLIS